MILDGNVSVIAAIKEKKRLMDLGESHEHLKILCVCNGGLIKGAYSVGVGLALEELGYTDVFTDFVGISSGGPSAAYFVGGNVYEGGSLIYEECCLKAFLNIANFWNPVNYQFLLDVLKGRTGKSLQFQKIFSSPTKLHIGVTEYETGMPRIITPNNEQALLDSIHASALMPNLSTDRVFIDGVCFMDGGFSSPSILDTVLSEIDYTHALILTSQNINDPHIPPFEQIMCKTIFRHRFSSLGLKATLARKRMFSSAIATHINDPVKHSLFVWGDGSIHGTERDGQKVKAVVDRSKKWWLDLMSN